MSTDEKEFVLSDDAIAEQGKTANSGENLRSTIAESLGFPDDEDHKDLIDKVFEREQKLRSGYGELLGKRYIPLKKAYQEILSKNGNTEKKSTDFDPDKFRAEVQQDTIKQFNEQFLDDSDFSDDFKVKFRQELDRNPGKTAQSVLKNSEYLQFFRDKEAKNERNKEAANNGNNQGGSQKLDTATMPDKFNDPKYMSTEKGRKEFDEWSSSKK